jgi:hypothetical protein
VYWRKTRCSPSGALVCESRLTEINAGSLIQYIRANSQLPDVPGTAAVGAEIEAGSAAVPGGRGVAGTAVGELYLVAAVGTDRPDVGVRLAILVGGLGGGAFGAGVGDPFSIG